jgi:hypothetical protein
MAIKLLSAVTVAGAGAGKATNAAKRAFQAVLTGTGALTAEVHVEVSLNGTDYLSFATIDLSGTTSVTDGGVMDGPWNFMRGNLISITGTGATLDLLMEAAI